MNMNGKIDLNKVLEDLHADDELFEEEGFLDEIGLNVDEVNVNVEKEQDASNPNGDDTNPNGEDTNPSANTDNQNHDPQVSGSELEPTVGMTFPTGDEYAKFCHQYAYRKGFCFFTRTATLMDVYKEQGVKRTESREKETAYYMMKQLRFVCKKGGRKQTDGSNVTDCKVFVHGNIVGNLMEIRSCHLEHNHELHPESSRLMVNYRSIDDPSFDKIVNNDRSGIPIVKNFNAFLVEQGGHENMTFNQRDLRNAVNLERRKTRFRGDAVALEEYFQKQHELNKEFYSSIQRDCDGRLMNVFWLDARCRAMCEDFGDIITFDTTFQTNRYEMPLAPFVAVNHHGSSIILACALISHVDTDTFVWVFNEWMKCMGKAPLGILTDQEKAILKAVSIVFPNVPHRLCLWHILKNASTNLGSNKNWKEIEVALKVVVHECLDPDEFDDAWDFMVKKFDIGNNTWIKDSYESRSRWAPCYCRDNYWAGMSSTQRSEGMNRFLKGFVNIDTPLARFVELYEAAMGDLANKEHKLNFASADSPLPVDKTILTEYVFHSKYSNAKFKEVREQSLGLRHTNIIKTRSLGKLLFFKAEEKIPTPIWRKRWKTYDLTIDKGKGEFSCSCKLFEFRGILCKHIIRAIELEDIDFIPEKYILSRWRKDIVRRYEEIHVPYYDLDSQRVQQKMELSLRHKYLSTLAMHNEATFELYREATDKIRIELEDLMGVHRNEEGSCCWWDQSTCKVFGRRRLRPKEHNERHVKKSVAPVEGGTKDPVDKRYTGRGKNSRTPNPSEKGAKCKKKGKYNPEEIAANEAIIRDTFGTLNGRWLLREPNNNVNNSDQADGKSNGYKSVTTAANNHTNLNKNDVGNTSQPSVTFDPSMGGAVKPTLNPYWLRRS